GAAQGGADQQKTGPITLPGAGNRVQKADTGSPGNFGPDDVVFGLSKGDPKTGPLGKFAGKALNAARPDQLPISQSARNPAGSLTKGAVNEGIARETVAAAKGILNASGGKLRFSLDGFDTSEALTPGSKNFDAVTSFEFRKV